MREFTKKKLIRKYELKKKIFFDLPNAIKFRNIKISKKKTNDLITVARLDSSEKYKGIDETLEVMAKMNKINFKYKIIGDGDDKMRLILKAKSLGCLKHVNFYGKISDKKRDILLKNSKIMIMPGSDKTYDTYPFRFIFLEAAEFGLYIIGSNPPEKKEKNLEKKYLTFNFVNPKDKNNIINLIKKLQKKNKIKDKNLFQDFSIKSFDKNLSKIIKKISR
jgi:hypothetical protein